MSDKIEGFVNVQHSKLVVMQGMHRSRTSAIARSLELIGVQLGGSFIADIDDPKGLWEGLNLLSINEALRAHISSTNTRVRLIDKRFYRHLRYTRCVLYDFKKKAIKRS